MKYTSILFIALTASFLLSCYPPGPPGKRMGNQGSGENIGSSSASFSISGGYWSVKANGIPLHSINRRDFVNSPKAQSYSLKLPAAPSKSGMTEVSDQFPKAFGITLDGVKLDPLTAECYDTRGQKKSRGRPSDCGYRLDALQTIMDLKFDEYFGHVQPFSGAYHYHAYSKKAASALYQKLSGKKPDADTDLVLIGLARDGYPVFYSLKDTYKSSYVVDSTVSRKGADGSSKANGLYVQDYVFKSSGGSKELDECNGISAAKAGVSLNALDYGQVFQLADSIDYFYVATERFLEDGRTPNFPAIGRCFNGRVSSSDGF